MGIYEANTYLATQLNLLYVFVAASSSTVTNVASPIATNYVANPTSQLFPLPNNQHRNAIILYHRRRKYGDHGEPGPHAL